MSQNQFELNLVPGAVKSAMSGVKSSDLWKLPLERIKVIDGFNVRTKNTEHKAQVRFIADSMKANGFFSDKPLAGFVAKEDGENVVYVIDGHTRLEAVHLANSEGAEITEIPVVTKPAGTSMEDLTVALVVSNEGRHLSPYEVALVCKRLVGYGMDEREIARRIGKTRPYVSNLLLLVSAPRAVTAMVQDGTVSATLAVEALKAHGKQASSVLQAGLEQARDKGKDKVTGKHMPKPQAKPSQAAQPPAPVEVAMVNMVLERGLKWISANAPQNPECQQMLAFLACVGIELVHERLQRSAQAPN